MTVEVSGKNRTPTEIGKIPMNSGLVWLSIAAVGIFAFFWDGILALADAWSQPEYSHGPLIPFIAGFLLLRQMRQQDVESVAKNRLPGFIIAAMGIFIGLVGNLTQIPYLISYGLIITIGGLILLMAGFRQGLRYWPAWVYLLFMLPLPNFMYWQTSMQLRLFSSELGVEFIRTVGVPVFLEGNIIDLGVYKLHVADACSGLRYLFPLMSFGFLFAVLYRGPNWQKAVLFLSTVPITILMNSFRIGVIGVLVNSFGVEQAEGFLHFFEGWIIFVSCIAILYLEALVLQLFTKHSHSALDILDLDFRGVLQPASDHRNTRASELLVTFAIVACLAGAAWQVSPARAVQKIERETLALFPMEFDKWTGSSTRLDPTIESALGADDYLSADYRPAVKGAPVNLFVAFYNSTSDGTGIHSPEICIPSGGWEVSEWQQTNVAVDVGNVKSIKVNRAIIQKGTERSLVYYWFEQRGRRFASEYLTKLYTVWDSFLINRSDGALVRVITPLQANENERDAEKRLQNFISQVTKRLSLYVPG